MVGPDRAAVAPASTFHAPGPWAARVELDDAAAHHARVKRLAVGDAVRLTSGDGRLAPAIIEELSKQRLVVACDESRLEVVPPLPRVELWAPVGDRDRMLLLAEKAVELGASAWRPVVYRRSRNVNPRGEGAAFREKTRSRMISALEQSGGAWLPEMLPEESMRAELPASVSDERLLLDADGSPLPTDGLRAPLVIAFGPEGGLDPDEHEQFAAAGWRAVSLGRNVLRFETAGIAALALARTLIR